jgi:hypothetical protein
LLTSGFMVTVYVDRVLDEPTRRAGIYKGDIHMQTGVPESGAIVEWARALIGEAFGDLDPQRAQFDVEIEEFVRRVGPMKSRFTNDDRTKELVRDLVIAMGSDPETTYFDLPRLRVVPCDAYLTAGVSYAYKAHRDTWYAHPPVLVNYWVPVYDCVGDNVMSMWTGYWDRPVRNSSAGFDYDRWVSEQRFKAASNIAVENRPHPLPLEPIDPVCEMRIAGNAGDIMLFSTCHLHSTAPNISGVTRFSYDLRTLDINDLIEGRGPRNPDGQATGTTVGDFLRVADLAPIEPPLTASR